MDFWLAMVIIAVITWGSIVTLVVIDKRSDLKKRLHDHELRGLREQIKQRDQQIADLEQMRHHLQQQIDWHFRLLGPGQNSRENQQRPVGSTSPGTDSHTPPADEQ